MPGAQAPQRPFHVFHAGIRLEELQRSSRFPAALSTLLDDAREAGR